jgi:hypothetical protein
MFRFPTQGLLQIPAACGHPALKIFLSQSRLGLSGAVKCQSTPTGTAGSVQGMDSGLASPNLVQTLYNQVTSSLDDIFLKPSMIDVMADKLNRQAVDMAEAWDAGVAQIGNYGLELGNSVLSPYALRALRTPAQDVGFHEKDAFPFPSVQPHTSVQDQDLDRHEPTQPQAIVEETSFTTPITDFMVEVFGLRNGDWLRKQALVIVIQQLLGSTIERQVLCLFRMSLIGAAHVFALPSPEKYATGSEQPLLKHHLGITSRRFRTPCGKREFVGRRPSRGQLPRNPNRNSMQAARSKHSSQASFRMPTDSTCKREAKCDRSRCRCEYDWTTQRTESGSTGIWGNANQVTESAHPINCSRRGERGERASCPSFIGINRRVLVIADLCSAARWRDYRVVDFAVNNENFTTASTTTILYLTTPIIPLMLYPWIRAYYVVSTDFRCRLGCRGRLVPSKKTRHYFAFGQSPSRTAAAYTARFVPSVESPQ